MLVRWNVDEPGVVQLPSGRLVRGRGLRYDPGGASPTLAVHLTSRPTPEPPWERLWIQWRYFWLPTNPDNAARTLRQAYERAYDERLEVACDGGVGRTGTALATLCLFEGMEPKTAVNWVREQYHRRAVEVPWQRWFLRRI